MVKKRIGNDFLSLYYNNSGPTEAMMYRITDVQMLFSIMQITGNQRNQSSVMVPLRESHETLRGQKLIILTNFQN